MSAYIVERETIDRVVTCIKEQKQDGWVTRAFPTLTAGTPNEIGQRLWKMNVQAVERRYEERNPVRLYKFQLRPCSQVQAIKSLACLLYQCSEGNVPETPLYKEFEGFQNHLAGDFVRSLPEWDQAEWA